MQHRSFIPRLVNSLRSNTHLSVRGRLVLLILCILLPMLVLEAFDVSAQYNERVQAELDSSHDYAEAVGTAYVNYLDTLWDTEAALGEAIALESAPLDPVQAETLMRAQLGLHPTVTNLFWISPDGLVLASAQSEGRGLRVADLEYFKRIERGEDAVVSDLIEGRLTQAMTVAVARGIRHNGRLVGVVTAGVDISKLASVLPLKYEGNRSYGLIDRLGTIVFRTDWRDQSAESRTLSPNSPGRLALKGQTVLSKAFSSSVDGTEKMGANLPVPRIGWAVYAVAPVRDVMAGARRQAARTLVGAGLAIATSLVGVWLISTRLARPIQDLNRAASAISRGDLSARVHCITHDELGTMAEAFNKMADDLSALLREREQQAADLQWLAERDHVTGLYNHRTFQSSLDDALARRREERTLSLLMIDIDHFKEYNDAFGHQVGDQALRQVAALLEENIRTNDIACRYGGEEFSVILPDTGREQGEQVGNRLVQAISSARFPGRDSTPDVELTVSIGLATCPEDARDKESLIALADSALYQAKWDGRNRVVAFSYSAH